MTSPNTETLLVSLLNADATFTGLGLHASLDVPETRPTQFVTIERTGGASERWGESATLAVQVWAKRTDTASPRTRASSLSTHVAGIIRGLRESSVHVFGVVVQNIYDFPDPDTDMTQWGRYQLTVNITVC